MLRPIQFLLCVAVLFLACCLQESPVQGATPYHHAIDVRARNALQDFRRYGENPFENGLMEPDNFEPEAVEEDYSSNAPTAKATGLRRRRRRRSLGFAKKNKAHKKRLGEPAPGCCACGEHHCCGAMCHGK